MPSSLAEILICAGSFRRAAPRGADSVMSPQFTLSLSHQEGPRTGQERHNGAGGAPRGQDPIVCGLTRPGWCWWDSCGGPGRGRVQICCKGAPDHHRNPTSTTPGESGHVQWSSARAAPHPRHHDDPGQSGDISGEKGSMWTEVTSPNRPPRGPVRRKDPARARKPSQGVRACPPPNSEYSRHTRRCSRRRDSCCCRPRKSTPIRPC